MTVNEIFSTLAKGERYSFVLKDNPVSGFVATKCGAGEFAVTHELDDLTEYFTRRGLAEVLAGQRSPFEGDLQTNQGDN